MMKERSEGRLLLLFFFIKKGLLFQSILLIYLEAIIILFRITQIPIKILIFASAISVLVLRITFI